MQTRRLRARASALAVILLGSAAGTGRAADLSGEVYATHSYARQPFPDERAKVWLRGGNQVFEGRTGSGGSFYLYKVPPGAYRLDVESPYGRAQRSIRVRDQARQDLGRILIAR